MSSVKYINNYIYFNDISDISINTIKSNNITTESISVNNLTGNFKNTLDVSLSNIDSSINLIDTSLGNFYINDFIDNSFTDISNKRNDYHIKDIINNKKNTIDNSINSITDSTYTKNEIETSFNIVNARLESIDSSFQDVNTKLNTIDTSMQYILDNDISFNGEKTFNDDITILGNLKSSVNFIIDGNVTISGDLVVDGTQTTINSNTIDISDKTILLASNSNTLSQPDGAGIEIYNKNGDNPSILYNDNSNCWNTNIGLDISGKITVKDNDFSMKVTNISNKKLDISMSNGDCVSINGNLNVTGEISSNNINELNNRINRINNNNSIINIENINYINNDKILSKYDGSNIATDFSINNGIDITNNQYGYNIFFTSISYDDIISDVSQNGTMSNHLEKYNMIDISNLNDFICLTNYNDNTSYEVSYNKIIIKNDNKYNLNFETNLDISIGNSTFIGDYFIDIAILKFIDNSINIITSEQKNISNLDDTTIDISINNNIIDLSKNNSIGFGFLIYCQSDIYNDISGINNYYVDVNTKLDDNTDPRGLIYKYTSMTDLANTNETFTRYKGGFPNILDCGTKLSGWTQTIVGAYGANNGTGFFQSRSFYLASTDQSLYRGSHPSDPDNTPYWVGTNAPTRIPSSSVYPSTSWKFIGVNIVVQNLNHNHDATCYNLINMGINSSRDIKESTDFVERDKYKITAKYSGIYKIDIDIQAEKLGLKGVTTKIFRRHPTDLNLKPFDRPACPGLRYKLIKNIDTTPEVINYFIADNSGLKNSMTASGYWKWGNTAEFTNPNYNKTYEEVYLKKGDTISLGFLIEVDTLDEHRSYYSYPGGAFITSHDGYYALEVNNHVVREKDIGSLTYFHPEMEKPDFQIKTNSAIRLTLNYGHNMSLTFKKINLFLEKDISYIETLYIDNNLDINSNIIVKNDISINDISINNLTSTNLLEVSDDVIINDIFDNNSYNNTGYQINDEILLYKHNDNVYIFPEFSLIIANNNDTVTHSISYEDVSTLPLPKGNIYKIKGGTYLTSIDADVFKDSSNLTNVDFTNCTKLVEISNNSFRNCTNLNSVNFTNCTDLSSIGAHAFRNCSALTSINFSGCTSLHTINIEAFYDCQSLTSVNLNDCISLTKIMKDGFRGCGDLVSVDFTNCTKLVEISNNSFYGCSNLRTVDFTGCTSLTTIGGEAFKFCSKLTTLDFSGCTNLTINTIVNDSFENCGDIKTVIITNSGLKTESDITLDLRFRQLGNIHLVYINDTPVIYNNDIHGYEVLFNLVTIIQISDDVSIQKKLIDQQTNTQITGAGYKRYKITVQMVEAEENDGVSISQDDVEYEWTYNIYGEFIEYTKVS